MAGVVDGLSGLNSSRRHGHHQHHRHRHRSTHEITDTILLQTLRRHEDKLTALSTSVLGSNPNLVKRSVPNLSPDDHIIVDINDEVGPIQRGILGRPLQELDAFVFADTFCVMARKFSKHYVFRFSAGKSLHLWEPLHPFRKLCLYAFTHQLFDLTILLIIVLNCITLAFDNNELILNKKGEYEVDEDNLPQGVKLLEWPFLLIFTVEAVVKIGAKGFYGSKYSYWKNSWNKMDFVIVVLGYITEILSLILEEQKQFDLDVFRAFRILRAVKTISIFPGLRVLLNSITHAIVQLIEVMALTFFCLCIFSLFALDLFMGKLHQTCVLDINTINTGDFNFTISLKGQISDQDALDERLRTKMWLRNPKAWRLRKFPKPEPFPCGNDNSTRVCPENYTCLPGTKGNPDDGWTSFDTFFRAMLSTFQLITLDYWERLYELMMSTVGPICMPFFVVVIFLGSFYLLNLMLAVVSISYEAEVGGGEDEDEIIPLTSHQKLALHRSSSTFSIDDPLYDYQIVRFISSKRKTPAERERIAKSARFAHQIQTERARSNSTALGDLLMDLMGRNFKSSSNKVDPEIELQELANEEEAEMRDDYLRDINETSWRIEDGEILDEEEIIQGEDFDDEIETVDEHPRHPASVIEVENLPNEAFIDPTWIDSIIGSNGLKYIVAKKQTRVYRAAGIYFEKVRAKLEKLVNHWSFEAFITICIISNTVILAYDHYDPKPESVETDFENSVNNAGRIFTGIFIAECIIKIFALRDNYFRQPWNLFDLFIVLSSIIDLVADKFPAIRVMRLLRIFKLAQKWITMKILLNIIFSTFGSLANLTLVLFIIIYIFAILGMQIVGKEYTPKNFGASTPTDDKFPRWNFKNFWYSFMMIFRVLCGEWIEPLWDCLQVHNDTEWKCFIIFLPALIIGNFIVLNLFLALLLNSFSSEELTAQRDKEMESSGKTGDLKKVVDVMLNQKVMKGVLKDKRKDVLSLVAYVFSLGPKDGGPFAVQIDNENDTKSQILFKKGAIQAIKTTDVSRSEFVIQTWEEKELKKDPIRIPVLDEEEDIAPEDPYRFEQNSLIGASAVIRQRSVGHGYLLREVASITSINNLDQEPDLDEEESDLEGDHGPGLQDCLPSFLTPTSAMCCWWWTAARKVALTVVYSSFFEWGIVALIIASSITLCFEDVNLKSGSELEKTLKILNYVFTGIFLFEMLLTWMALGFRQYFTTFWTILDFFIIIVSVITLIDEMSDSGAGKGTKTMAGSRLSSLKSLRTLRALRPLRAISKWQGMKVVVNALINSIPSIIQVLFVCLLFWLVFAIMGVNIFKGKFYRCVYTSDLSLVPLDELADKHFASCCKNEATTWLNTVPNFDNVFWAYLSLFQVATFEGWIEVMKAASDVTDAGSQPIRDNKYQSYIFFVVFIVFGSFFTLNLFIGVIIDNFNTLKKKYEGNFVEALLTSNQRRYYAAVKKLGRYKPRIFRGRPKYKVCAMFYDICMSRSFEVLVFIMILSNTLVMAFSTYGESKFAKNIIGGFTGYFNLFFAMEAVVKIIALQHHYFKIPWNLFDFGLVILSIVDLASSNLPFPPTLLRVVRVFRVGRLLRLIKAARGIRKLLFALIISLPALFNIGALLTLITFIYSILGMSLFKNAVKDEDGEGPLDSIFSFETFVKSSLMLFRLFTAAGWNEVLDSLLNIEVPADCGSYRKLKCGGTNEPECVSPFTAVLFMVSYIVVTFLIIINMYIAVILENFVEANRDQEIGIFEDDLEEFYINWSRYDPRATQFIGFHQLSSFLANLEPPLQIPEPNTLNIVQLNLPIADGNRIHCLDVLHALVKFVVGRVENGEEFRKVQRIVEETFRNAFPNRKSYDIVSTTKIWRVQHNAAYTIQRAWRTHMQGDNLAFLLAHITHPKGETAQDARKKSKTAKALHTAVNFFKR